MVRDIHEFTESFINPAMWINCFQKCPYCSAKCSSASIWSELPMASHVQPLNIGPKLTGSITRNKCSWHDEHIHQVDSELICPLDLSPFSIIANSSGLAARSLEVIISPLIMNLPKNVHLRCVWHRQQLHERNDDHGGRTFRLRRMGAPRSKRLGIW